MNSIGRGLFVYLFLLVVFRLSGKRTLAETTNFDLVMLLIISETTQQAMVDNDHSITNAVLLILTLVGATVVMAWLKQRFPSVENWLDGRPVVVIQDGQMHRERMFKVRVDEEDILSAARRAHGLERMEQVKHAVVERDGSVSIIPKPEATAS